MIDKELVVILERIDQLELSWNSANRLEYTCGTLSNKVSAECSNGLSLEFGWDDETRIGTYTGTEVWSCWIKLSGLFRRYSSDTSPESQAHLRRWIDGKLSLAFAERARQQAATEKAVLDKLFQRDP
ncbi:MAG: hypothetical protein NTX65_16515 [Ignavibacteriales bacterium]|nr:hypothetical protein [Ignavibacteriales bacterium]